MRKGKKVKKIQTKKFKRLKADLIEHPPVNFEEEPTIKKDKKLKKIYQLNEFVEDIDINDMVE